MSSDAEIEYELMRPFGPSIGDFTVPEFLVDNLNAFVDATGADTEKSGELDHSSYLAGEVEQEIKVPPEILKQGLGQYLMDVTGAYVMGVTGRKITQFRLLNCWVVRSFAGDFNPPHMHDGHVSGAGYLMVPEQISRGEASRKADGDGGFINFHFCSTQFASDGMYTGKPRVGHVFLFPNYLSHSVNPFQGEGERRSFSFNAMVDDDIYDIYRL
ncbi:MAG: putative 2OG-Fe(II) oxygenase [Rhodospirillales bacterium]